MEVEGFKAALTAHLSPGVRGRMRHWFQVFQMTADWGCDFFRAIHLLLARIFLPSYWQSSRPLGPLGDSCRRFDYEHALVPNRYIAGLEASTHNIEDARRTTGLSLGYPAWNLIYYALMCGLRTTREDVIVVETGTNRGITTIMLAQALMDAKVKGRVYTVDIDPAAVALARENLGKAGLQEWVELNTCDSISFLKRLMKELPHIDFAFLDGCHTYPAVMAEFALVYPKVLARGGMVFFDNTCLFDLRRALRSIQRVYGGNLVEFDHCSWGPPGNVIWQPSRI